MLYEKIQKLKLEDWAVVLGLGMLAAGVGLNLGQLKKSEKARVEKNNDVEVYKEVVIDVGGEVIKPGVYKLANGSRVNDALIMAGGLGAGADREWVEAKLNKADVLRDGQKIYIPSVKSQIPNNNLQIGSTQQTTGKVSLNTATMAELDTLPGVGPGMAQKIINYREVNGVFKNIEELKLVSGIGDKTFEELKDLVEL